MFRRGGARADRSRSVILREPQVNSKVSLELYRPAPVPQGAAVPRFQFGIERPVMTITVMVEWWLAMEKQRFASQLEQATSPDGAVNLKVLEDLVVDVYEFSIHDVFFWFVTTGRRWRRCTRSWTGTWLGRRFVHRFGGRNRRKQAQVPEED